MSDEALSMDPEALARLARFGGTTLLRGMIDLFLSAAPKRLAAARAGLGSGDAAAVAGALHALKSSAGQLGAMRLARLCADGERRATGGALADLSGLMTDLDEELQRFESWLAQAAGTP